jgi:hypothetical protein
MSSFGYGQQSTFDVEKTIYFSSDTIQFDTASVYKYNFRVSIDGGIVTENLYVLDGIYATLLLSDSLKNKPIKLQYSYLPIDLSHEFFRKSDTLIIADTVSDFTPYLYSISTPNKTNDLFGSSQLNKQGSVSRGVTVGNNQNLALQSTLNLQLNGKIGPNLFMKGAISDDNIPFQPDGNTQKLQEFDQVYMQVYNDKFAVTAGDFWLKKPEGYFMNYNKRMQGLSIDLYKDSISHKVSGAFSKGKFSRYLIQGVEGNQGPYRLVGAENEQFIIVLAGTEKIYIDGELLKRGQEFDYIIDYNTAEVTFTANRLITKDKRIAAEFQYSDLNYARSLFAYNTKIDGGRYKAWVNYYSEQDSKNQSIQQSLNTNDKLVLANSGDSLDFALSNSIDSVGYSDNRVLYELIDTLGFDSILVFSVNSNSANFQASFQYLGENKGDYILDQFTANGKVYKWVAPIGGVPQGGYKPVRILVAPQRKQLLTVGASYLLHKTTSANVELAYSNFNKNTFSKLHSNDDKGVGLKFGLNSRIKMDSLKSNYFISNIDFEYNHQDFTPIEWFRSTEFDRDWNVRYKNYKGYQFISAADVGFINQKYGEISYKMENLVWGQDYSGWKNNINAKVNKNDYLFKLNGSWLLSNGEERSNFLKHKSEISKHWNKIKVGVQDEHEKNQFFDSELTELSPLSYQFYDAKAFLASSDSIINKYEVFYQQRYDWRPDSSVLTKSAKAQNFGISSQFLKNKNNIFKVNVNYRILDVLDTTLIDVKPENTILSRLENHLKLYKGVISSHTFYELGSGLELKKEFIYLQVNAGQGTYSWNDYNADGVKDLDEFEVSQFTDQAEYIRVFLPTNEYVRTYSNQFSQTLFLKPERLWGSEDSVKGFIARFSDQLVYKVNRKTNYEEGLTAFNPFEVKIADTSLISTTSTFRNTVYFNRTNSKFGLDYTYQENGSKILLSNGFDKRLHTFNKVKLRWNITKLHSVKIESIIGRKKSESDYSQNRTFNINYQEIKPVYSFQPSSKLRISLNGKYSLKINAVEPLEGLENEKAEIKDVGLEIRVNQPKKGSLLGQFNFINIAYNAENNTSLAYEMLEGLKIGNNFTVGLSYQRKVAKNLQLNFNYNGRISESSPMIHSGGMELRAFF